MKKDLILIGGGGHCKSVIDVIETEGNYSIAGIIDVPQKLGYKILGYEVVGNDADIYNISKKYDNFHISLGHIKTPQRRIDIYNLIKELGATLPIIISPFAHVSKYAKIGEGTIIMHQALVNAGSEIGANCIINSKALIEHDVLVEDHCHISTNATVNGNVKIGTGTFFGSNAISRESVHIAPNSFVKANSLVK